METAIDRIRGETKCTVYTSEPKFIRELDRLAQNNPGEVEIIFRNTEGEPDVMAKVPMSWFKFIKPPAKRNFTDKQKAAMATRMKQARDNKKEDTIND